MPPRRVRESTIERLLVRLVQEAGGEAFKMDASARAGVPDRLVVLPGNRFYFVELKTLGGSLSPIQRVFHTRARRRLGVEVVVLWTRQDVCKWVSTVSIEA